jgi:L-fuconolactonase
LARPTTLGISPRVPTLSIVDAHLHLWNPERLHYPWLAEVPAIASRHALGELERDRGKVAIDALVFVQCDCRPEEDEAEVEWVSALAKQDARLAGIVAGCRLERGAAIRPQLERYARNPLVKGVRRLIQSESDPRFCLAPAFLEGARLLAAHGLTFDLCIRHHQLASAIELVQAVPEVVFVLDHLGKPDVRGKQLEPWRSDLARLARAENVVCKLSGLVTEADHARWTFADLAPYVEHALDCFGPQRLLFGSDWPVARLATSYSRWVETLDTLLADLPASERDLVWRGNARRVYRLD